MNYGRCPSDSHGDMESILDLWQRRPYRGTLGWVDLLGRRRYWRLEVASEVQLPDRRRRDPDSRTRCVLRRSRWQLLCAAANGQKLWGLELGGAIGGGVITYTANGAQKVAVATGFTHLAWPTKIVTAKIVVLGLDNAFGSQ